MLRRADVRKFVITRRCKRQPRVGHPPLPAPCSAMRAVTVAVEDALLVGNPHEYVDPVFRARENVPAMHSPKMKKNAREYGLKRTK